MSHDIPSTGTFFRFASLLLVFLFIPSCVSDLNYKPENISGMTDISVLQELQNTELKLAKLGVSAQYLAQTRPAPTYTLTGRSFYTGTFWRYGNMGQFTFQGLSIYSLTPDYHAQFGYVIAQAIIARRVKYYLQHRTALLNEIIARSARREAESHTTVKNFYEIHSDLRGNEALVASIAPWVDRENRGLSTSELLNSIASRTRSVMAQSKETLNGEWFGLMVQQNTFPDGQRSPFWLYVRSQFRHIDGRLSGVYHLIDGSSGVIEANINDSAVVGRVINTTYKLGFEIKGRVEKALFVVDFQGQLGKTNMEGRAVLIR